MILTRRAIVSALVTAPAATFWPPDPNAAQQSVALLDPTPSGMDAGEVTPPSSEGPFYALDNPQRADLTTDVTGGEILLVGGFVLDSQCGPLPGAVVSLWQADQNGAYDTEGVRLRGYQLTDADGRWLFRTIKPALYAGRTRHIHFKVRRAGGDVLTTELFFPGEARNAADRQFDPRLVMDVDAGADAPYGRYDFVIA